MLAKTNVWDDVLELIGERLSRQVYDTWFRPISFLGTDDANKTVRISAGSYTKDWVCRYYSAILDQTLTDAGLDGYTIDWEIDEKADEKHDDDTELIFETKQRTFSTPGVMNYADVEGVDTSLNPKYTFEKFVVGSSNQFAHAAALGASEMPGTTYNPLFIYGGVGLGKTHLMHAIGHAIKARNSSLRVAYITSEKFMNELINAIRFDKTPAFRDKYRSIDVLLLDDVQFLAGKDRTQEEFFHTFNTLHNNQKQIVISSDCPPREIPTLQERLHSRFEWGLIADIEPPDLETKVAILKRKADLDGYELDDDIAMYIAGKIKSNVRELEGSLVRLVAIASLKGLPLSKMLAQQSMKNIIDAEHPHGMTMERIARAVASHYKMTVEEMKSKSNSRAVAVPRQVAMYLCKRLTRHSFPEIGREFGGKHHTTVMHSVDKISTLMTDDRVFHNAINELIDNLCN
ncbi:MAG: chromosomal replication initiator protein DnaA [Acidobacteria bacterium]|nr:chromosomal replication initiator protein DnaA [Acidobacteriota bacterium]